MEVDSNASNNAICNSVNSFDTALLSGLNRNLISVGNTPHTTKWEFDKHGTTLRNNNNGDNLLTAHLRAGLYSVKTSQLACALTATADLLHDWHLRLGHLNVKDVMRLSSRKD